MNQIITYYWEGIDENGIKVYGTQNVGYAQDLKNKLIKQNILLLKMRKKINFFSILQQKITTKNIDDVYDKPQKQMLKLIIDYCIENNSRKALKSTKKLCEKGYTGIDIVTGIFSTLKSRYCDNICGNIKITMCEIVSESSYNMTKGLHTDLQLYSCILTLSSTKYDNYL